MAMDNIGADFSFLLLLLVVFIQQNVSSESTCGQICPPLSPNWNRICDTQTSVCGFIPVTSSSPSAPKSLHIEDYPFHVTDRTQTLALNITWQLPDNATGLKGFVVELLNTQSSDVQMCKQITFKKVLEPDPNLKPPVTFSLGCWHDIYVDSIYKVTVRSLGSGQNVSTTYHSSNCNNVPGVQGCWTNNDCQDPNCPSQIPTEQNWKPRNKPTASVHGNQVDVEFDVYPGNYWLDYRVNLFSFKLGTTPQELHKIVNSLGKSKTYTTSFYNVTPGTYKAEVKINLGDTYQMHSKNFTVSALSTVTPTIKVKATNVILGGVAIGVVAAVLILVTLVIAKRSREGGSRQNAVSGITPTDSSSLGDRAGLVNNMMHDEPTFSPCRSDRWEQGVCQDHVGTDDSYIQGSFWTDFTDTPCVHSVQIPDVGNLADFVSVGGESGIPV